MWTKRKHERRNSIGVFKVYDRYNNAFLGKLDNLSPEGLMICAERPLSRDQIYHLRIDLPNPISNRKKIFLDAECRWCRRHDQDKVFGIGLKFINIPEGDAHAVEYLLSSWSRNNSGVFGNNLLLDK